MSDTKTDKAITITEFLEKTSLENFRKFCNEKKGWDFWESDTKNGHDSTWRYWLDVTNANPCDFPFNNMKNSIYAVKNLKLNGRWIKIEILYQPSSNNLIAIASKSSTD